MFGGMISNVDPVTVYNIVKDISQGMEIDIRSGQVYLTTYSKEMWLIITNAGISSLLICSDLCFIQRTHTETDTDTDKKMCTEPNGNLHRSRSLSGMNTTQFFPQANLF